MRGRRQKLTAADRRRRADRNSRRGRIPSGRPPARKVRCALYRYAGYVVRVIHGRLEVVRIGGLPVAARPGAMPRQAATLCRLPERYRSEVREEAAERDRRRRVEELGVELPPKDVWQPSEATGAAR